ncbi:putative protein-S-isoprenylcysteine O-methyltransferase [Grifola frondosa]|uniref:Protein-S-isoprenylcysteine O-methyltransferase n=1 Tax=Grifola frondosa TaxID=5627 RepID=A0A1C7LPS6_GRIFR|nr:putative protein-S-isoprenylcysteine O-methyltransferase [Grifola frondosa]
MTSGKSPRPPPKDVEVAKFDQVEKRLSKRLFMLGAPIMRPLTVAIFAAEAVVIVAENYAYHPHSQYILHVLRGPSHSNVRVSVPFLLGCFLLAAGTYVRAICYKCLGRFFTFELAVHNDHKLVTTGPYSVVRHPAYSGVVAVMAGVLLVQLGPGSWADCMGVWHSIPGTICGIVWSAIWSVFAIAILLRTGAEDKVLRHEFGKEWDEWAKKTPYKLLPGVF